MEDTEYFNQLVNTLRAIEGSEELEAAFDELESNWFDFDISQRRKLGLLYQELVGLEDD